jgi:hypothetical protein|tara:strand:+ start:6558 stop:6719 length:162 start_codon:yes stop_codon:yes gene_type:complete
MRKGIGSLIKEMTKLAPTIKDEAQLKLLNADLVILRKLLTENLATETGENPKQ